MGMNPTFESLAMDTLGPIFSLLLSPHESGDPDTWRRMIAQQIQTLVGADAAVFLLWSGGTVRTYPVDLEVDVLETYLRHYAAMDAGMQRQQELGLEVWSRQALWESDELARSVYYNEFARPNELHDAIGLSVHLGAPGALDVHSRISLLYRDPAVRRSSPDRRLALLEAILPVFRAGLSLQLHSERWLRSAPSLLDQIGQRLALFSLGGRELYRNASLRRALAHEPERTIVEDALQTVARATPAAAHGGRGDGPGHPPRRTHRCDVHTSMGRYRLRGSLIGPEVLGPQMAALVTVDHLRTEVPSSDMLQTRFGLTRREAQIATLLAQRLTNAEIARTVGLSPHTARHHTESVLLKLGVHTRRALRRILLTGDGG